MSLGVVAQVGIVMASGVATLVLVLLALRCWCARAPPDAAVALEPAAFEQVGSDNDSDIGYEQGRQRRRRRRHKMRPRRQRRKSHSDVAMPPAEADAGSAMQRVRSVAEQIDLVRRDSMR